VWTLDVIQGEAKTLEEIERELLRSSSVSVVPSQRPNGELLPAVLTVEELERKLRSNMDAQSDGDTQSSLAPGTQPTCTTLAAILSSASIPVTRVPGLLPIVPGSIPVVRYTERCLAVFKV